MASLLFRLGRTAYRRWPIVVVAWLVGLGALFGVAHQVQKPMVDSFTIPGIPSVVAQDLQGELFGTSGDDADTPTVSVVVAAPEGHTLSEQPYAGATQRLVADLKQGPQVASDATIVDPVTAAKAQYEQAVKAAVAQGTPQATAEANAKALLPLSADGRVGTISYAFDAPTVADVQAGSRSAVLTALDTARDAGLTAEVQGQGMQETEIGGLTSEAIGIGVAAVILLFTFGSLVAAGLPLVVGVVGIGGGILSLDIATHFFTIATTAPILATMIGLAVGIDYTLFILSRYRSELAETDDRATAAGLAVGRAGSAVVFAGLTVIIALAALSIVGIPFLTAMGLAAAGTVLFAVVGALTLLPAVLGALGHRLFGKATSGRHASRKVVRGRRGSVASGEPMGVRWAQLVRKAPAVVAVLIVVGLGALAVPAKSLHLALPSDSTASTATTQRQAADLVADAFGPGRNGPMVVVVDGREVSGPQDRLAAYGQVVQWVASHDDVANVQVIGVNEAGTGAQILITPASGPDDKATTQLLDDLRAGQAGIERSTGTTIGVTGLTAIQSDVSEKLADALPIYLAVIIGLAFVLLVIVFRSILVPLTATFGFLLTILATIGATVLVFQEGLFGLVDGAPLVSFMPVILIGIVFGLAMDYQVFLVTRMREAYVHGDTAKEAVVDGFRHGARVVTAAALIMISVFAAFVFQDNPLIQSIGFALAFAVLIDAFVVRMTLIPALMYLMRDKAWWIPRWLDRVTPNVDVEGESLTAAGHGRAGSGTGASAGTKNPEHEVAAPA